MLSLLLVATSLLSCTPPHEPVSVLKPVLSRNLADSIYIPRTVTNWNGTLIITDHGGHNRLVLVSKDSLSVLGSLGKAGRGPGELRQPIYILPCENRFIVNDPPGRKLLVAEKQDNGRITLRDHVYYKQSGLPIHMHYYDGRIYVSGIVLNGLLGVLDSSGEFVKVIGTQERYLDRVPPEQMRPNVKALLYHSYSVLEKERGRIALLYRNIPLMNVVNLKTEEITTHVLKGLPEPDYTVGGNAEHLSLIRTEESYTLFTDVVNAESVIYALYSGKPWAERNSYSGMALFKIGWNGSLLEKRKVEEDLLSLAVDDGYLYGLTELGMVLKYERF